jgi:hypothetical protein
MRNILQNNHTQKTMRILCLARRGCFSCLPGHLYTQAVAPGKEATGRHPQMVPLQLFHQPMLSLEPTIESLQRRRKLQAGCQLIFFFEKNRSSVVVGRSSTPGSKMGAGISRTSSSIFGKGLDVRHQFLLHYHFSSSISFALSFFIS